MTKDWLCGSRGEHIGCLCPDHQPGWTGGHEGQRPNERKCQDNEEEHKTKKTTTKSDDGMGRCWRTIRSGRLRHPLGTSSASSRPAVRRALSRPPARSSPASAAACRPAASPRATGINAFGHEPRLPAPDRRLALAGPPLNLHRADPFGAQEDNPSPPHMLLRAVPRPHNGLQPFAVSRTKPDFNTCSHPSRLAYPRAGWNHSSAPIH